jgi:hypothetical protein
MRLDSYRGSGSQTGPHIKISISSIGADGKDLRDFDNQMIPRAILALWKSM